MALRGLIAAVVVAALFGAAQAHHGEVNQHKEAAEAGDRVGELVIESAWARAPLGPTAAAYVTLRNEGTEPDRLVGVASDVARTVELHTHVMDDGVMRMRPIAAIEANPGEPAVMKPGSSHIMMMGLQRDLNPGDAFVVILRFERTGEVPVLVDVLEPGASGPETDGGHERTH